MTTINQAVQDNSSTTVGLAQAAQNANINITVKSSIHRQKNRDLIVKLAAIQSAIDNVCLFKEKLTDGDYLTISNNLKELFFYLQTTFTTLIETPIVQEAINSVGRRDKRLVDIQALLRTKQAVPCPCCNRIILNNKCSMRKHKSREVCKVATDMIRATMLLKN